MFLVVVNPGCEMPRLLQRVRSHYSFVQFFYPVNITSMVDLWGLSFGIAALLFAVTRILLWYVETARQCCALYA